MKRLDVNNYVIIILCYKLNLFKLFNDSVLVLSGRRHVVTTQPVWNVSTYPRYVLCLITTHAVTAKKIFFLLGR